MRNGIQDIIQQYYELVDSGNFGYPGIGVEMWLFSITTNKEKKKLKVSYCAVDGLLVGAERVALEKRRIVKSWNGWVGNERELRPKHRIFILYSRKK